LRRLSRILLATAFAALLVYACDFLLLRFKIATNRHAFDTVTIQPLYAVPQKDGKTEFLTGDPQDQACANSLFPQAGDPPCWYLRRKKEKPINM